MRIRKATPSDAHALVALGKTFVSSGRYWGQRRSFDDEIFAAHIVQLINSPVVGFFVAEENNEIFGAIVVAILPDILTGKPIAMKLHWYAEGGCGLKLERAARKWAKEQGATEFKMSAMNDRSAKLLERLGYTRTEVIYSKVI